MDVERCKPEEMLRPIAAILPVIDVVERCAVVVVVDDGRVAALVEVLEDAVR